MRNLLLLSALATLALSTPLASPQQDIDLSCIDSTPDPEKLGPDVTELEDVVHINITDILVDAHLIPATPRRSLQRKRDIDVNAPCAPQPAGSGPVATPDTPDAFLSNPALSTAATTAPTPPGYTLSFSNLKASISEYGYMGLYTLTSYDPAQCAALCDANYPCQAFNLYFERDPTLNPSSGAGCPNPASLTNIKCTLWGYPTPASLATNAGQWRTDFQVVIAGSNGYQKTFAPQPQPGWSGPVAFPGGAVNAPSGYLGYKFFKDAFNPVVCTGACDAQTAYNRRHPSGCGYKVCRFVNAYVMLLNGQPQGFYCAMYESAWGPSYATNGGQTRNGGADVYQVVESFGFSNGTVDSGLVC